tara:strand:- start:8 stop:1507 length:1500 start_codon:yes stop_codon:yes gene_type:complete
LRKINSIFFLPYGIKEKQYERGLEVLQCCIDAGENVGVINCEIDFLSCFWNLDNRYDKCLFCIDRAKNGLKTITGEFQNISLPKLSNQDLDEINNYHNLKIKTISELKSISFENCDIGFAVSSLLIDLLNDPNPDLTKKKHIVNDLLWSTAKSYILIKKVIGLYKPDSFYIHNGREGINRGCVRACEDEGVQYYSYEGGYDMDKYHVYDNHMPQDSEKIGKTIKEHWDSEKSSKIKNEIANDYFMKQKSGVKALSENYNYTKDQNTELLPSSWDYDKKNVAIYNTTENEFASIDYSWELPFYKNQIDGIKRIVRSVYEKNKEIVFYLRIHPNYAYTNDPSIKEIYKIDSPNLKIINANSKISTYKLMDNVSTVITFISTAGVESSYWGIPTIVLGTPFYHKLGGVYLPSSHDECVKLIAQDLKPLDNTGAKMWGYYVETWGVKFKYYKHIDHYNGLFKNIEIKPSFIYFMLRKNKFFKKLTYPIMSFLKYFNRKKLVQI